MVAECSLTVARPAPRSAGPSPYGVNRQTNASGGNYRPTGGDHKTGSTGTRHPPYPPTGGDSPDSSTSHNPPPRGVPAGSTGFPPFRIPPGLSIPPFIADISAGSGGARVPPPSHRPSHAKRGLPRPAVTAPAAAVAAAATTAPFASAASGAEVRCRRLPRADHAQKASSPLAPAAALLDNKRHRDRELLVEVSNEKLQTAKQVFADQYGVEVREVGVLALINARIWHLTLVQGQDLRAVLEQLLQDGRVISVQPNYIYTPVQGASPGGSPATAALPFAAPNGVKAGAGVKVAVIDTMCRQRSFRTAGVGTGLLRRHNGERESLRGRRSRDRGRELDRRPRSDPRR